MIKGQPAFALPFFPDFARISSKIALGVIFVTFLLDYQPNFSFPPVKKGVVHAQTEQTQTINAKALPFEFQLPHPGYISTKFSSYHPGIDLATGLGMPIKPIAPGTVVDTGFNFWGLGLTVTINHGQGYESLYAHMGNIYVKKNQIIGKDETLGTVGLTGHTTGPHTHLEVYKDNQSIDPQTILPPIRQMPIVEDFQAVNQLPVQTAKTKSIDFKKELNSSL